MQGEVRASPYCMRIARRSSISVNAFYARDMWQNRVEHILDRSRNAINTVLQQIHYKKIFAGVTMTNSI